MKVLEERLVYLFTVFCKDLLCSYFHFGSRTFICMSNIFVFPPPSPILDLLWFWGDFICFHPRSSVHNWYIFSCVCWVWLDDKVIILGPAIFDNNQPSLFNFALTFIGYPSQYLLTKVHPNWRWPQFPISNNLECLRSPRVSVSSRLRCFVCFFLVDFSQTFTDRGQLLSDVDFRIYSIWASHIGSQSLARIYSTAQHFSVNLQDILLSVCGVFPILLCFTTPGRIPVYPGWVICAIWTNGSEWLNPACLICESDISSRWKSAMSV